MGVAVCTLYLEDAVAELQYRNVERTATEIIDRDALILFLIQTIGQRSCRRLIDNTHDLQASNFSGISGCLALRVIKVGWDRDHGLRHPFAQVGFGVGFQLL